MDDLRRELAPVPEAAWSAISDEATRTLKAYLAARKLVDFDGPKGWSHAAVTLGRVDRLSDVLADDVEGRLRRVQPLVELRAPFELSREELDAVARGAEDPDLDPVVDAARKLACAEDRAVFYGYQAAGIRGMCEVSAHDPVAHDGDVAAYPDSVVEAIEKLREAGIGGPYALAVGSEVYNSLAKVVFAGGYSLLRHIERTTGSEVVWAPALSDGVLLSVRGSDFALTVGRDVSIGYLDHDLETVRLYLEESITYRTLTPEAAVRVRGGD